LTIDQLVCLAARADKSSWKWHAKFGHLNFLAMQKLYMGDMVRGLPAISEANRLCDGCIISKQRRVSFPSKLNFHVDEALELDDLCGPIKPATPGGKTMFLLMVDDMCRYMCLIVLSAKSDAARMIKQVQVQAEVECGKKLKVLCTDRGGEFTSSRLINYCNDTDVRRHLTVPYSPQQNGVVERRNQTIIGATRSMLKAANMPRRFWGEAIVMAVYLLNRSPTHNVDGKTPY
jgi:hypothetical protein